MWALGISIYVKYGILPLHADSFQLTCYPLSSEYVYIYIHTLLPTNISLYVIYICAHVCLPRWLRGQDSHPCEAAAGLVLELCWPLHLSLECDGQTDWLCTTPALSVSVLHRLSPQSSSAGGMHRISSTLRDRGAPLETDPIRAVVSREDQ